MDWLIGVSNAFVNQYTKINGYPVQLMETDPLEFPNEVGDN